MLCSGAAGQSCAAAAGAEPPSGEPPPAGGGSQRRQAHQEVRRLDAAPGFVTIVTPLAFTDHSALRHMTRSGSW